MYSYTAPAAPSKLRVAQNDSHTGELHNSEWGTNVLHSCAQSPCWQHQLSSDNKPQWQGKEKKSFLRRNRNQITPLSNHI